LKSPLLLFEKLTCLALVLSIFLIWIFLRAIFPKKQIQLTLHAKSTKIIKHILLKIKFLRERDLDLMVYLINGGPYQCLQREKSNTLDIKWEKACIKQPQQVYLQANQNFVYLYPRKRIIFFKIKYKQIFLQTRRRRRR
jgi:hypothetical protein